MQEIKLSNGVAKISTEWKWKHEKRYMAKMLQGGEFTGANFADSKEEIIKCLLVELKIGENVQTGEQADLEEIEVIDINKIYEACKAIRDKSVPDEEEKKRSKGESKVVLA